MDYRTYTTEGLEFDPIEHKYFFKGRVVPSVTQILDRTNLIDKKFFTEEGRIRGTAVHDACFFFIQNSLVENKLHKIISPYFEQFKIFMEVSKFIPNKKFCESIHFNNIHFYAGKIDLFGMLNGRHALIDIKTGVSGLVGPQTAAYAAMPTLALYRPLRYCLTLTPNKFELKQLNNINDLAFFLKLLK